MQRRVVVMQRRTFLGVAAALTALLPDDPTTTDERPPTQECAICGAAKPARMVERTTVAPIAPRDAATCRACQHVQNHTLGEGRCMQCGEAVSPGFAIELAFPLGAAALPGTLAGQLCGDCADALAGDITDAALAADEAASDRLAAILAEETRRLNDLPGAD